MSLADHGGAACTPIHTHGKGHTMTDSGAVLWQP